MTVHLLTNASLLNSSSTYQQAVYQIHSLGKLLPLVEWAFIFGPLLFHGLLGLVIIWSGRVNISTYQYSGNVRYTLQRITGVIAFVFIFWHVFHMHGWFHADFWMDNVVRPLGGGRFRPYSAASTLGMAMQGFIVPLLYGIGILSAIFHLANGIWTLGITWGLWITPAAQRRASWVATAIGAVLAMVGMGALFAATTVDIPAATEAEDAMYRAKVEAFEIPADEHLRAPTTPEADESGTDDVSDQAPDAK